MLARFLQLLFQIINLSVPRVHILDILTSMLLSQFNHVLDRFGKSLFLLFACTLQLLTPVSCCLQLTLQAFRGLLEVLALLLCILQLLLGAYKLSISASAISFQTAGFPLSLCYLLCCPLL